SMALSSSMGRPKRLDSIRLFSSYRVRNGAMFRYMAAIWDPRNETARQAAERMESTLHEIRDDWNPAFQACGIRVYSTGFDGGRAYVLPERRGVILGRLFRRSSNARIY